MLQPKPCKQGSHAKILIQNEEISMIDIIAASIRKKIGKSDQIEVSR